MARRRSMYAAAVTASAVIATQVHPEWRRSTRRSAVAVVRGIRVLKAGVATALDYKLSLRGLEKGSEERAAALSECHKRCAERCLAVCRANKGVFIKVGQGIAAMRPAAPPEFTEAFLCLTDAAPVSDPDEVMKVISEEVGSGSGTFSEFDPTPVGSASLAQVHRARLSSGEEVAVKVQHPTVAAHTASDLVALSWVVAGIEWSNADLELRWAEPLIRASLERELDFRIEARQAARIRNDFDAVPWVVVPHVHDNLSSKRVLVMSFEKGVRLDNAAGVADMKLSRRDVARRVCELFGRQMFLHGFVHADPHPGNLLVRPDDSGRPQLVLLDYGLCREIGDGVRVNYAALWRAMVLQDVRGIDASAEKLGLGRWSRILPMIFIHRGASSRFKLGEKITDEERAQVREEFRSLGLSKSNFDPGEIGRLLKSFPEDLVFVLRTMNLVRGLCSDLGAPNRDRFSIYARLAAEADPSNRTSGERRLVRWLRGTRFSVHLAFLEFVAAVYVAVSSVLTRLGLLPSRVPAVAI